MSLPPTPWEVVEGAPNGEAWVCASGQEVTQGGYDEPPEQEDMRLFSAPPLIAAEVVRRVNGHAALIGALEAIIHAASSGHDPRLGVARISSALRARARAAISAARGAK